MKLSLPYKKIKLTHNQIVHKYIKLRKKYEKYISHHSEAYLIIFFSIMIMENYNRPWYFRLCEYILFVLKKSIHQEIVMSLGIMQVKTNVLIGNVKSIKLADELIYNEYNEMANLPTENADIGIGNIAEKYNPSQLYKEEIIKIYTILLNCDK